LAVSGDLVAYSKIESGYLSIVSRQGDGTSEVVWSTPIAGTAEDNEWVYVQIVLTGNRVLFGAGDLVGALDSTGLILGVRR